MRVLHLSTRMAATGVAAVLAAGALVAGTAATADAAVSGGATYTCSTALGSFDVPVAVSSAMLPTSGIPAGTTVPPGVLPVNVDLTLPVALVGGLAGGLGVTGISGTAPGFSMLFGSTSVPIDGVAAPLTTLPVPAAAMLLSSTGKVGSFVVPAAGTYDISMPESFSLSPVQQAGIPLPAVPCTIKDPATAKIATATVAKSNTSTTAKAVKATVKKGKQAVLNSTVTNSVIAATGKVAAFDGTKKVGTGTLNAGKAKITLAKMAVGVHKITVKYLGDGFSNTSQTLKPVKVTVIK